MARISTSAVRTDFLEHISPKSIVKTASYLVTLTGIGGVFILISLLLAMHVGNIVLPNRLQDFFTLSLSIVVEAVPFVVLGALISSFVQTFVSQERMLRILPRSPLGRRLVLSLTGSIFPVCECGNVPVARSLLTKGLETSEAITFLLAAPILNPLTLITTWEAFRFDHSMVAIRIVGAFVIANVVGWVLHHYPKQRDLVTENFAAQADTHEHHHDFVYKKKQFISLFVAEFWSMFSMLSIGAFVAAGSQSFIARTILLQVGSQPVLSVLAMLALAFVISLCANVDAFFALAYSGTFTFGALAAFLLFGPMIDVKTLLLMKTTFRTRTLAIIGGLCLLMSLTIGLLVNYAL